jgi:hypothetical protein
METWAWTITSTALRQSITAASWTRHGRISSRRTYDAFGAFGTIFRELEWKTLIFFLRERSR